MFDQRSEIHWYKGNEKCWVASDLRWRDTKEGGGGRGGDKLKNIM